MPSNLGDEAWLVCQEQGKTRQIDLLRSPLIFGRDSSCDFKHAYQGVSRRQFSLENRHGEWVLIDLNSSNGTLVNKQRIQEHVLRTGDKISIGGAFPMAPVTWTFHTRRAPRSRLLLTADSSPEAEPKRETQFSFDLAELEEQATSGVFHPTSLSASGSRSGGILSDLARPPFRGREPAEAKPVVESSSGTIDREFDMHGAISLFSQMGQALLDSQGLEQLLERTLELVFRNVPAQRGSIWLCHPGTKEVVCEATRSRGGGSRPETEISQSIVREAVESRQALLVRHVRSDERFQQAASIQSMEIRSAMCAPLYHKGDIGGFLYVDTAEQSESFSHDHLGVLTAMAMFTATGIEKIRSVQQTIAARNHLQSVLQSLSHLVLTIDREGRLQTVNRCPKRQLGLDEDFLRNHPFPKWFQQRNEEFVAVLKTVYQTAQPSYLGDYELVAANGQRSSVNCTVVPLLDFQNEQTGVVAILEDVTREKRITTALGRYLSPALAQRVMQEGETRLGGVKQKVTVLFSDIRGYTALTEAMDAQQIVEMLNAYFSEMVEPVFAERGFLDKYMGDALMAVFGVPYVEPDDAIRACRTALGMQRALKVFNERQSVSGLFPIRIGIGLNTGDVVSGNIGSEKRLEYTCIGDSVNLASRVEGVSKLYGVTTLITQYTHQELGGNFITREVDCVRVLGKQEPIRIYELVAENLSELSPAQQDSLECYQQGLTAYRNRDWRKAREHFGTGVHLSDDGPSRTLDLRCQHYLSHPPGPSWDGTHDWDMK